MAKFWKITLLASIFAAALIFFVYVHTPSSLAPPAPANAIGTTTAALPPQALLNDNYYVPQTFNNCAPAALSMDLSFYGVQVSQETLADALRPDHNTTGHDDEKSTPPQDVAAQAEQYGGLIAYYRPAGNLEELKQLVAAGFPVIVRTLFMPTDQVAHYRVIIGYNDATGQIIDEDGYQGPHVTYSYNDFLQLWKYYNYEYVVLAPPAKQAQVEAILGSAVDPAAAWRQAAANAEQDLVQNPADFLATFNLSVANYYLGNYGKSVAEFESVQPLMPQDTLWYQIEPIEAYYQVGDYSKVFSLSQAIFDDGNPAVPELYVVRGQSYLKEGNTAAAKIQFETALQYNMNLESAKEALANL